MPALRFVLPFNAGLHMPPNAHGIQYKCAPGAFFYAQRIKKEKGTLYSLIICCKMEKLIYKKDEV